MAARLFLPLPSSVILLTPFIWGVCVAFGDDLWSVKAGNGDSSPTSAKSLVKHCQGWLGMHVQGVFVFVVCFSSLWCLLALGKSAQSWFLGFPVGKGVFKTTQLPSTFQVLCDLSRKEL